MMRTPLAAPLFYLITVLFSPIILLGYLIWIGRLLLRRSAASATAQGPLSARWMQHHLGVRRDTPAARLLMTLPGVSPIAVWLLFGPLLLAYRLSGYVPQTFRYPFAGEISLQNQAAARQTFYDTVVDRYVPRVAQFVILGAGFDTRALRLPAHAWVRSFEVDTHATLTLKQAALAQAKIDSAMVIFVPTDFSKLDWFHQLTQAGLDTKLPTLFIWEGVTPYLDRAAVMATLQTISQMARGSVIAFDFFTSDVLTASSLYLRMVRTALRAGGEPLKFGIENKPTVREQLDTMLQSCGLSLSEYHPIGQQAEGQTIWGGFVLATVNEPNHNPMQQSGA